MSSPSQFSLLFTRRFLPLFIAQSVGAFNDNAFRYALSMLYIYGLGAKLGINSGLVNTLSAGLLTLPFLLFSALAGQIADKFDKAVIARTIKLVEIGIVALASFSLFTESIYLQLACVFLSGVQSAFFGPIKYAILPQHLKNHELLGGNGMVEMGTFISVLLGTMFGSVFILNGGGRQAVSTIMIILAVLGYVSARNIPTAPSTQPNLKINFNIISETWHVVKQAATRRDVFMAILGISWFWFLGLVFLTQIPLFTHDDLHAREDVATIIVAVFTVAIGLGSLFCNLLLKGKVSLRLLPVTTILMSVFMLDLYFAASRVAALGGDSELASRAQFLSNLAGLHVLLDLGLIAFFAGLFVVPLFALAQAKTPNGRRARMIGANNIMNAIFMIIATVLSGLLLGWGLSVHELFLGLGVANACVAFYIIALQPRAFIVGLLRFLLRVFYRVEVKGLENYRAAGSKALIVANHTSYLDIPLLASFLPEHAGFAYPSHMNETWREKFARAVFDLCLVDPANPLALRNIIDQLKRHRKMVVFPEGRITTTGGLMKVHEGPAAIAQLAGAKILPTRIDGALYSPFSLMRGKLRLRWFPKITISFLPPIEFAAPENLKGGELREYQAEKLYDVMAGMMFGSSNIDRSLWQALLEARAIHGGKRKIIEDIQRNPLSYDRLVMGSLVLGRKLAEATRGQKNVGVLLPNAIGCVLAVFGLLASGRRPAMLNYSTGAVNMAAACVAAEVRSIITSRRFIEVAEMQKDIELLGRTNKIIYLEDVRAALKLGDKLYGLWAKFFTKLALKSSGAETDANQLAIILFTSGSEGLPKGVALSHRNLNANWLQVAARISFTPQDKIFNALPVFHAFGLTGGMMLPLLGGVAVFHYPSPLHYKIIPELCYDTNATALFGTDTFLVGYARNAHPYDFFNVRLVVAGAERVKPETREVWMEKFGLRILEGYGATECSPVIAVNTPMHYRSGSVGRILDAIEYRLEPVAGIDVGGRLFVKGPNVMLGYVRADNPGEIEKLPDGWYDTGDIVDVDPYRFVTILGRAKRFAKIAGEMISLAGVEHKIEALYPDFSHAIVAVPDKRKGEQLVMFTTLENPDRKKLADALKAGGATDFMVPKTIFKVAALPLLGSGKTDYVTLGRQARERVTE